MHPGTGQSVPDPPRGLFFKIIAAKLTDNRHLDASVSGDMTNARRRPVSKFDRDLDIEMVSLESEWRQVYEASIAARADYQSLAANKTATADALDSARERLDRAEALRARIMAKIDRLEKNVSDRR